MLQPDPLSAIRYYETSDVIIVCTGNGKSANQPIRTVQIDTWRRYVISADRHYELVQMRVTKRILCKYWDSDYQGAAKCYIQYKDGLSGGRLIVIQYKVAVNACVIYV